MSSVKNPVRTTIFVALTAVLALVVLSVLGLPKGPMSTVLIWFLACLGAEAFWIKTPTRRGTISMALTIDLAALFTLSPAGSLFVVAASTLLAGVFPHRRPWYKVLFNTAQTILAAAAAIGVLRLLSGGSDGSSAVYVQMTWLPLFAAGVVFFLVNSGLVSLVIALSSDGDWWKAWHENYGYGFELWCTVAQISLSGFVLAAYQQMGAITVIGLLPVLGVLWWSSARESQARAGRLQKAARDPEEMKLAG